MKEILDYLLQTYNPSSIIIYGLYADGTNNLNSDFDALVISRDQGMQHDTSFIDKIQLDVFVYPESHFDTRYNCEDFIQIMDGKIILDENNRGKLLKENVLSYIKSLPKKSKEEIFNNISWCEKMLLRTQRLDVEGMFRWHWVLVESLEIFCNSVNHFYRGPKKALLWMENNRPEEFRIYTKALLEMNYESLKNWIDCLKGSMQSDN